MRPPSASSRFECAGHFFLGQRGLFFLDSGLGGYLFAGLLDLPGALEPTFVLLFPASTVAIRVFALSLSAARRALWVALRWLARRFISFALFVPRIGPP